ncbi:MAG: glycosyltransferase family 87 protein [Pedobacter sp.]|nr:glycosyltransferase family 87 protein [Pedobacter sp.]MDQ8051983.1 glycosyltransferase family 87 protein [Pedobacter sp.]
MRLKPIFNFLFQKRTIICVYILLAVVASLKQYLHGSYNNYLIFKYVFWHTWEQKPLYLLDQAYLDSNHYGPFFSIIIAPFALLPDSLGTLLWNLANTIVLLIGIFKLPLPENHKKIIAWICSHECLTSLLSFQFNVGITGLILLSFVYMEKQQSFKAALYLVIGFLVKLYGIVAFAFFLFNKKKLNFLGAVGVVLIVLFCLPMLLSSPSFMVQSYVDWFHSLTAKSLDNEVNLMADISFLGFIRKTFGLHINVLYGCALAGLLLLIALMRSGMYRFKQYRMLILSYVLLCLVLFNTNVESPTYIIGFVGLAIWFILVEKSTYTYALLIFAIILTSFSPSDLFPKFIRQQYVIPYALKAVPCILIWFDVAYRLLFVKFRENKVLEANHG